MTLVGRDILSAAVGKHGKKLEKALAAWAKVVEGVKWKHLADLKQTWASADYVKAGKCVVFNIKGNDFRLTAKVNYRVGIVNIERVMTHTEYDRWSANLQ